MKDREFDILDAVVREYIGTGDPVSSGHLFERYDFGIRPAMIRAELNALEDDGYLEQPHHSAGRVPSDKGFRFYARAQLKKASNDPSRRFEELFAAKMWSAMADMLSSHLNVLGVVQEIDSHFVHKDGLQTLIDSLEWETPDDIRSVIRDFEELDAKLTASPERIGEDFLDVFIGKESPITRSDNLAVMMGDYETGDGDKIFLCAIGPRRMDYGKAAHIFKGLKSMQQKKNNG